MSWYQYDLKPNNCQWRDRICSTRECCPPSGNASSWRGYLEVIMSVPLTNPPSVTTSSLVCPICENIYHRRKELPHHLYTSTDEPHKTFRYHACALANASRLLELGVLPCPLACGALFDGETTCTSRPLEAHIACGSCRARRSGS